MEMTRTFYPVGQGAFFTEVFSLYDKDGKIKDYFTVVYDCGSLSGKSILENNIDRAFGFLEPQKIDYLFLSHLDADHVNGIEYLIDKGILDNFTTIVLPFYKNYQIELLEFTESKNYSQLFTTLVKHQFGRIVFIPPTTDDNTENRVIDMEDLKHSLKIGDFLQKELTISKDSFGGKVIEIMGLQGLLLQPNSVLQFRDVWEYIPFTMNDIASKDFFRKIEESSIIDIQDLEDNLNNLFKKGLDSNKKMRELKNIYNSVGEYRKNDTRVNINSLVLLSQSCEIIQSQGRQDFSVRCEAYDGHGNYFSCNSRSNIGFEDNAICVYTGDINLKSDYDFDLFEKIIKQRLNNDRRISLLQLPHHGSATSYNDRLTSEISVVCFTNFDTRKRIFNKSLLFDFVNIHKPLFMVTEDYDSTFVQEVFL